MTRLKAPNNTPRCGHLAAVALRREPLRQQVHRTHRVLRLFLYMWRVFISLKNIQSVYIIVSPRGRRSSGARLLRRVAYLFRRVINYVIRRRRRRRFFLLFSSTFRPKGNCYQNTEYRLSLLVVRKFSRPDIFVERKLWHVENANRFSLREREAEHPVTSQCASRDRGEWD